MVAEIDIFVCVSCRPRGDDNAPGTPPGSHLVAALRARLAESGSRGINVREVECLAVCKRPATIALAANGKWTYLIGDLEADAHLGNIVASALAYQRSANGIVPWAERPAPFRKGVIARIPPLGFEQPATETA